MPDDLEREEAEQVARTIWAGASALCLAGPTVITDTLSAAVVASASLSGKTCREVVESFLDVADALEPMAADMRVPCIKTGLALNVTEDEHEAHDRKDEA